MSARNSFSFIERWLLRQLHQSVGRPPIRLILGDRQEIAPAGASSLADIVIPDRRTLARLLLAPEMSFGEMYAAGRVAVRGDLVAVLETAYRSLGKLHRRHRRSGMVSRWMEWTQANSLRGSRKNIHHHYDVNTDFFRLWLDPQLLYTCAYFPSPSATLEEAQAAKMDYVCRKLRLQPGERVVEAGCGWGALAFHMAGHYGVTVRAFNISREQVLWARQRAQELGLSRRVEFIEDDYRNISGECDAFVSVGMLEHVGLDRYRELGRVIHRTLAGAGRGLLHFIGRDHPRPLSVWIRKHIFPGAYPPTLREALGILEPCDFSVLDVENLRLHYARTMEHWLERFERSSQRVAEMFDQRFVRAWRLYLAGAIAAFHVGTLQLFQIVFARQACRLIPSTRAHLYQREQQRPEQETKWIHVMS